MTKQKFFVHIAQTVIFCLNFGCFSSNGAVYEVRLTFTRLFVYKFMIYGNRKTANRCISRNLPDFVVFGEPARC